MDQLKHFSCNSMGDLNGLVHKIHRQMVTNQFVTYMHATLCT